MRFFKATAHSILIPCSMVAAWKLSVWPRTVHNFYIIHQAILLHAEQIKSAILGTLAGYSSDFCEWGICMYQITLYTHPSLYIQDMANWLWMLSVISPEYCCAHSSLISTTILNWVRTRDEATVAKHHAFMQCMTQFLKLCPIIVLLLRSCSY